MKIYRPAHLRFEFRDSPDQRLRRVVSGAGDGGGWIAHCAHLEAEVELDREDLALVGTIPEEGLIVDADSPGPGRRITRLLELGVVLSDEPAHELHRKNDRRIRCLGWWTPAALAQRSGRWDGIDVAAIEAGEGPRDVNRLLEDRGAPPSESFSVTAVGAALELPSPERSAFDELLEARSTCRNFDPGHEPSLANLSTMLHRVFAAQGSRELAPGAVMLKKNSPSGGGLHPVEAFLLVQRLAGLESGLYHYHAVEHSLEPMQLLDATQAASAAYELVAGQRWFANAPVLVLMAARFGRTFWKYPNHAKAWKVIQLDAGHLSQNFYLSATELGYGAFITAAINDKCAERLFGLDGISTGAIAVCGFGKRAAGGDHVEFDPLGRAVR